MDLDNALIDEILSVKIDDGGRDLKRVASIIIGMLNIPEIPSSDKRIELPAEDRKMIDILIRKIDECDAASGTPVCTSDVYIKIGNILFDERRYDSALKYYEKAITLCKENLNAWMCIAKTYHEAGRYIRAIECYDECLRIKNDIADVWAEKALSLIELGRCLEALECCDRAIDIDKNTISAWYNKALAYIELDMYADALICIDIALKIMPVNDACKRMKELCMMFLEDRE